VPITETISWEVNSWESVLNVLADYVGEPYECKRTKRPTVSIVHSPLGTWVSLVSSASGVAITGYYEEGKEIKEKVLEFPFVVKDLMSLLILVEDASRIVSRSPVDPYYTDYMWPTWVYDQDRYRNRWDKQDEILPHEVDEIAEIFHKKNSIAINGTE
tara:strand:- start:13905 stop:14378 length:474 start_codon:yes stop_codon:yes gene_type:complete